MQADLFEKRRSKPRFEDCCFYHTEDLPGVGTVQGEWDLRDRFDDYIAGTPLTGKRVLDIGTASGFLTWESEKRGAEVVSFDLDHARRQRLLPFKDTVYCYDRDESERQREKFFNSLKNSYWYGHHAYGSRASVYYGDIELLPRSLGHFDVALVCSVIEHLPDHIQALASIGALADRLVIVTPILDAQDSIAKFVGFANHPEANFSFWQYSLAVYREVLAMMGFEITDLVKNSYRFVSTQQDIERSTLIADRR